MYVSYSCAGTRYNLYYNKYFEHYSYFINRNSIKKTLNKHKFDLVINCAAMAKIIDCEKNVSKAININIVGTFNLVKEILSYEIRKKTKIKIIHISSDGVYPSQRGNYLEKGPLGPYNVYGWTKLASEFLIRILDKHIVIRTRFFDKEKIKFKRSANDIFTSNIEVNDLVKKIKMISSKSFIGVINVGLKRHSDYVAYKKFKDDLKVSVFALGSNTPRSNFGMGDVYKYGLTSESNYPKNRYWNPKNFSN